MIRQASRETCALSRFQQALARRVTGALTLTRLQTWRCVSAASLAALVGLALAWSGTTHAQVRTFPANSQQVRIGEVGNGLVVINGNTLKLAPGLLVFNENNRTIVRSRIPAGVVARVLVNTRNEIQRVWILTVDEIEAAPQGQPGSRGRIVPNRLVGGEQPYLPAELPPGD